MRVGYTTATSISIHLINEPLGEFARQSNVHMRVGASKQTYHITVLYYYAYFTMFFYILSSAFDILPPFPYLDNRGQYQCMYMFWRQMNA